MSIFANCGEYLPGQEPPTGTSSIPPGPIDVVTPIRRKPKHPKLPRKPDIPPTQTKYKCDFLQRLPCPTPYEDSPRQDVYACRPCDGLFSLTWGGFNPAPDDPTCTYDSSYECNINCRDIFYPCPIQPPSSLYKCECTTTQCPFPLVGTGIRDCECVLCPPNSTDPACRYATADDCEEFCVDSVDCVEQIRRWRCIKVELPCPDGQNTYIEASCEECLPIAYDADGRAIFDPDCIYPDEASCQSDPTCVTTECPQSTQTYKCVVVATEQVVCPPGQQPTTGTRLIKDCLPCVPDPNNPGAWLDPTGALPGYTTAAQCVTLSECVASCESTYPGCSSTTGGLRIPDRRWSCSATQTILCPPITGQPTTGPGRPRQVNRQCIECPPPANLTIDQKLGITEILNCNDPNYENANPATRGGCWPDDCVHSTLQNCINQPCNSLIYNCDEPMPTECEGPACQRYRCEVNEVPCPPGYVGVQLRQAEVVQCTPDGFSNGVPIFENPLCIWPSPQSAIEGGCVTTQGICLQENSNSTVSIFEPGANVEAPDVSIFEPGINVTTNEGVNSVQFGFTDTLNAPPNSPPSIQTSLSNSQNKLNQLLNNLGSTAKTEIVNTNLIAKNSKLNNEVTVEKISGDSTEYHPYYNFFDIGTPNDDVVIFVDNDLYRNIFSDRVAREVKFVLNRNVSSIHWSEVALQEVTNTKLGLSLNPILLKALNNLKYPSGEKIPVEETLEIIKSHLITGTLDEFDENYYIILSEKQGNSPYKEYLKSSDKAVLAAAALTIIRNNEVTLTKDNKESFDAKKLKRQKRLNVDIEAATCVIKEDGSVCKFNVENQGLLVGKSSGSSLVDAYVGNGPGDGYYLYLNVDGNCLPLEYDTKEETARYVSQNVRFEALKLLGEDPYVKISCESTSGSHEFTSGVDMAVQYEPIYMRLNLSSVSSIPGGSYLAETVSANYSRLVNQAEINEHSDTYGFATTRVHIDYRDPIYKYIYDTSTLEYSQNEVTLAQLEATSGNNPVITKNLPFALVIVPVKGSVMNPFNGFSEIQSVNSKVKRSITFIPNINYLPGDNIQAPLEEKFLFLETGNFKVGLTETPDTNAITYRFNPSSDYLTKTYYNSNTRTYDYFPSSLSAVPQYGLGFMVKDVIDFITSSYDTSTIGWFDVYRRMTLPKFAELFYDADESLITQIGEGFRNNLQISDTFLNQQSTPPVTLKYAGTKFNYDGNYNVLPEDDKVIITVEKRIDYITNPNNNQE